LTSTTRRLAALVAVAAVAFAGCGRDDKGTADGATPGVTTKPCPDAVDKSKGCIYLGAISDLSGSFKAAGVPMSEGQRAFWKNVNENGGIGDYEVDVTTYAKDSGYDATRHAQAFSEIKSHILAMALSLGTNQTESILSDADAEDILIFPGSQGSNWLFEDAVLSVGSTYCGDAMNAVDYAVDKLGAKSIAAIHFPGDYGDDAAVGTRIAAEARGVKFTDIPTVPGADQQTAAIAALLKAKPDVVAVHTGPVELAALLGGAAAQGFKAPFIGATPTWNIALLKTPVAPALETLYYQTSAFPTWDTDSPGHRAMRQAAGDMVPNDYFDLGWTSGYFLKAVLEKAVADGDVTREGMRKAAASLDGIDGEGMLQPGVGNYAGGPDSVVVRTTYINRVDKSSSTGVKPLGEAYAGPTARDYEFTKPCFLIK
jgi:ABC-type branched-subunit amino acid transport system substrate-binding protein